MTNATTNPPALAIIGGSGAYKLLAEGNLGRKEAHKSFANGLETPFGRSAPIHYFSSEAGGFYFISRHGEKEYALTAPFIPYRENIYALKALGVHSVLSWSGPGIINKNFSPGGFFIPDDCIDETKNRPSTFFEKRGIGFIRMDAPFCPVLRGHIASALKPLRKPFHNEGVYLCTEGPRLETRAEIRKYQQSGADVVGMTLIPEVFLARELELCYASLCYLTNYAEGLKPRPFSSGALFEGMATEKEFQNIDAALSFFPDIIQALLKELKKEEKKRACFCTEALRRYKNKGMLSEEFREWFPSS